MEERELTFGEKSVGLSFNPGGLPSVDRIKKLSAELIDEICKIEDGSDMDSRTKELKDIAIKEVMTAQMWAVKATTWNL